MPSDRLTRARKQLRETTCQDPQRLGGMPCLRGHRISIAQLLSELACGDSVADVACAFDLDAKQLTKMFDALSAVLAEPTATVTIEWGKDDGE